MATLAEYQRFITNEPESQREIRTLEIYHPQFGMVRYVDNYSDISAGIEAGAPRNAGETVTYSAATLTIQDAADRGDADQLLSVSMGATDTILNDLVSQVEGSGFFDQIEVVYRKYYSADLSEPAVPPAYLFGSSLSFTGETATFTAEDIDLEAKRSGIIYTLELFPGLK